MSTSAIPLEQTPHWLEAVLSHLSPLHPKLSWTSELFESGMRLRLSGGDADGVIILLMPLTDTEAYTHTPSITGSVQLEPEAFLTEEAGDFVEAFFAHLRTRDDGTLQVPTIPKEERAPDPDGPAVGEEAPPTPEQLTAWRIAHEELADDIHFNAFLALQSLFNEDLYPHSGPLGEPVEESDIHAAWRRTAAMIREGTAPQKLGLYVHIPFCTVECTFCYCGKTENFRRRDMDAYVDELIKEAEVYADLVKGIPITSVYFGGGTPSLLSPKALRTLFTALYSLFDVPEGTQVIFEGNPDSLKPEKVKVLGELGRVTRLTVGIQTLDPEVQKYVRRYNRKVDVEAALSAARDAGIPHINFDCIAGLEGQSFASFTSDIEYILSLEPDSIHINGFMPLPRTNFAMKGKATTPEQRKLRGEMLAWGEGVLADNGYKSLLQQENHRTVSAANIQEYNLRRQNSSLIGLGFPARSHAFAGYYYLREHRTSFDADLQDQLYNGRRYLGYKVDVKEEMYKFLVTNIRASVDRREFLDLFGVDIMEAIPEPIETLVSLGKAKIHPSKIELCIEGRINSLIYRGFCYSPKHRALARQKWGPQYDRWHNYYEDLKLVVPPED